MTTNKSISLFVRQSADSHVQDDSE